MSERRADRRRADHRAYRPTLDGTLESKRLMSVTRVNLPHRDGIQTAFGGQAVELTNLKGQSFYVVATTGTVRAYRMTGGRFGLILDGTDVDTEVSINPINDPKAKGSAHLFNGRLSHYDRLIDIGSIRVTSGTIGSILGYRTAVLSGPLLATSTNRVDRIAFDTIAQGASINVGGDINTLDVLNNLTLSGRNTGILVGRDVNSLTVGGNLAIGDNATLYINRDLGLTLQPAKGTGPAGQGATIGGNLVLRNGGKLTINRTLDAPFVVNGATYGANPGSIRFGGIATGFTADQFIQSRGGFQA